jgi:outer membrane lipoprotein-sorting protein
MAFQRVAGTAALILLLSLGLSSCIVRSRIITRKGGKSTQPLLVATKAQLIDSLAKTYSVIDDINATVDMTPALGSAENSKVKEYKDIRAYILMRKDGGIRIVGLYPVVRSKAFDMASNGSEFHLYLPVKNQFIVGKNELGAPSANKLENLRPQHFQQALFVRPVQDPTMVLMENFTDAQNAYYILHELTKKTGEMALSRTIWFNRINLRLSRQLIFDDAGNILTDARYDDWQEYDHVPFPKHVEIDRPRDEYGIIMEIVKMDINKGVTDDKFELSQPEGSTLKVIGQPQAAPPEPAPARK